MPADYTLKLILIRTSGTGKIINKIVANKFSFDYKQTQGVDFLSKRIEFGEGKIIMLSIWDI